MKIKCTKPHITDGVPKYCLQFEGAQTISITLTERDLLDLLSEAQKQLGKESGVISLLQMNHSIQDLTDAVAKLSDEIFKLKMMEPTHSQQYPWSNPVTYKTEPLKTGPITCAGGSIDQNCK